MNAHSLNLVASLFMRVACLRSTPASSRVSTNFKVSKVIAIFAPQISRSVSLPPKD